MHSINKRLLESDDEDDLELLRLAALKSLKKPTVANTESITATPMLESITPLCNSTAFSGPPKMCNKRGRFRGNGRVVRNGSYNNRVRNYNLISVPTVEQDITQDPSQNKRFLDQPIPKLILPQDRYRGIKTSEEKVSDSGSKFDRYNDSEQSGTDSESEHEHTSETEISTKIERSDSLEALLQELENEIQGISKPPVETVKPELKLKTKVKKLKITEKLSVENNDDSKNEIISIVEEKCELTPEIVEENLDENKESPAVLKIAEPSQECDSSSSSKCTFIPHSTHNNVLQSSPLHSMPYVNPPMQILPYTPVYSHFPSPVVYHTSLPYPFPNLHTAVEPVRNTRPVSPLTLNTDILNSISAPLSPRSAAFVLQNRKIVESRKKSPRRSYSRSPSPDYRGSLSPRYRRSPKLSPVRRSSPVRNISKRPSPKPKSNSRHCSPKHSIGSNYKHTRHNRTDANNKPEDENKSITVRKSQSPENLSRTNSPVDAILEARRKKFETGNAIATEGVIRLKPKTTDDDDDDDDDIIDTTVIEEDEVIKEDLQDEINNLLHHGDELDLGITVTSNEFFSEEETDSDNEGRFKSNHQETNRVSMVPFTQLLNETSKMIRNENRNGKPEYNARTEEISSSRHNINKAQQHRYSSNELAKEKTVVTSPERKSKSKLRVKIESKTQRRKPPIVSPIENKKIEIRIRNPSKYESTSFDKKDDISDNVRKVEVSNLPGNIEDNKETKSFSESDDSKNEGDLRTQLSRKRAERQKLPVVDGVQSRLLQNALQGAIYKKSLKTNKEKEMAPSDGKLPIHLRLGIPGSLDIFSDVSVQKSSNKISKNRRHLDQV